jgi:MFS family permease
MFFMRYMIVKVRPESAALTADQMHCGQRWVIRCSCLSILFLAGISDRIIALFLLKANPSTTDATLAFFFALGPMMAVLTALTSPMVATWGKKRILVPFYLASLPFLVILAVLPSLPWLRSSGLVVTGVALALTGFGVFRALGAAGWFPILNDNVPDETRGRFFGRLRTSWQLMVVVYTAAVGWFLGQQPEAWQFQVVFLIAVVANLAMTVGIFRIPEAPLLPSKGGETFWNTLAEPFRDRSYVYFLVFGVLFNLAVGMAGPFALRCLKGTLGAGDNFIVWMDTAASIGAAATLPLWGWIVDRFGGRTIFAILVPPFAVLNLLWLFANPFSPYWQVIIVAFYVIQGTLIFGIGVGITDMMLGSARKGYQSTYINIAFVLNTLAIGGGPFLGALVARCFAGVDGQWGFLAVDANRWVFVFRFFLMLAPLWFVTKLSREHGGRVGEALQRLTAGLLNLLPSIRR